MRSVSLHVEQACELLSIPHNLPLDLHGRGPVFSSASHGFLLKKFRGEPSRRACALCLALCNNLAQPRCTHRPACTEPVDLHTPRVWSRTAAAKELRSLHLHRLLVINFCGCVP